MQNEKSKFYGRNKLMGYNAFLNYIFGIRWGGKTTCFKEYAIEDAINDETDTSRFIWLRRFDKETNNLKPEFLPDIQNALKKFKQCYVKGDYVYLGEIEDGKLVRKLDDRILGRFMSLNTFNNYKSAIARGLYNKLIFDECLTIGMYANGEIDKFMDILVTCYSPANNFKIYCIANNISEDNIYFNAFDIKPKKGKEFTRFERKLPNGNIISIVIHYPIQEELMEELSNTAMGGLLQDSKYGVFAFKNEALKDDMKGVKVHKHKKFTGINIKFDNIIMGVYTALSGCLYIAEYQEGKIYSTDLKDISNDIIYIDNKSPLRTYFGNNFKRNYIQYQSLTIKNNFIEFMTKII